MIPRSVSGITGLISLLTPKGGGPTPPPPPPPVSCVFPFTFPMGALVPTAPQYPAPGQGQTAALILPDHNPSQNIVFDFSGNSNIDTTPPISGIPVSGNFAVQINVASNMPAGGSLDFMRLSQFIGFFNPTLAGVYIVNVEDDRGNGGTPGDGTVTFSATVSVGPGVPIPITLPIPQNLSYSLAIYFVQIAADQFNVGFTFNGTDLGFLQDSGGGNFVINLGAIGAANEIGCGNQVGQAQYASGNDPAYSNTGIVAEWEFNAARITEPLPAGFSFTDLCGNPI